MSTRVLVSRSAVALLCTGMGRLDRPPEGLPRPPGVGLTSLPLVPAGAEPSRPRETSVSIDPRDPRHLVVSFQQMRGRWNGGWGEGFDVHAAWSADGGETWAVGTGTEQHAY